MQHKYSSLFTPTDSPDVLVERSGRELEHDFISNLKVYLLFYVVSGKISQYMF